jgi:exopolysaccharide biosynthesis polyprenyl glycosylphosphotransferase
MTVPNEPLPAPMATEERRRPAPVARRARTRLPDSATAVAVLGDFAVILVGLIFGFWFRFKSGWVPLKATQFTPDVDPKVATFSNYAALIGMGALFLLGTFIYQKLYDSRNLLRFRHVVAIVVKSTTFWLFAYLFVSLALKFQPQISRIYVVTSYVACLAAVLIWRWLFHRFLHFEDIARGLRQHVVFIGWNKETDSIANAIQTDTSQPYHIAGCLPSPTDQFQQQPPPDIRRLGRYDVLPSLLKQNAADVVILADLDSSMDDIVALSNLCEREMVSFKIIPTYFQILVSGLKLETISGVPIMGVSELPLDLLPNRILKRTVDLVGAVVGLLLSVPIVIVCGILIFMESPGGILFGQERVGRRARPFRMLKLRSMKTGAEKEDHLSQSTLRDDPRVLRIGKFMRRWNLDEVPQFWNVLMGHMSLVGPRPERPYHSDRLSQEIPHYNARYTAKPGMTGWAQVHGLRGDTNLVERVRFDLFYLENWSLWLDFQIMAQTFLRRKNAY